MSKLDQNVRDVNFVEGLKSERMKTYRVRIDDNTNRVAVIYEAYDRAKDGDDCIATLYMYDDNTNEPAWSLEKKAKWDGQWDLDMKAAAEAADYWLVNGEEE